MAHNHFEPGESFRENVDNIRAAGTSNSRFESALGKLSGDIDLLPKPTGPRLITGRS